MDGVTGAFEAGQTSFNQRCSPSIASVPVQAVEIVAPHGETVAAVVLVIGQDVDRRRHFGGLEGGAALRGACGRPKNQRRIKRDAGKAVCRHAEGAKFALAGHNRHAGRELAKCIPEGAGVGGIGAKVEVSVAPCQATSRPRAAV